MSNIEVRVVDIEQKCELCGFIDYGVVIQMDCKRCDGSPEIYLCANCAIKMADDMLIKLKEVLGDE